MREHIELQWLVFARLLNSMSEALANIAYISNNFKTTTTWGNHLDALNQTCESSVRNSRQQVSAKTETRTVSSLWRLGLRISQWETSAEPSLAQLTATNE